MTSLNEYLNEYANSEEKQPKCCICGQCIWEYGWRLYDTNELYCDECFEGEIAGREYVGND